MWIRLATILLCIVFFITGCNSLVSQLFGTHKLRAFTMDQVLGEGIADSDFIEISGAWQSGDYIVVPPLNASDKPIVIYPLLSENQLRELEAGKQVKPQIIGWTKDFDLSCDDQGKCAPKGPVTIKGVVREMRSAKNQTMALPSEKYAIPELVNYVEVGRSPIAWYWNVLMMIGGLGLAFYIENRAGKQVAA
jgi:hypothetical protein